MNKVYPRRYRVEALIREAIAPMLTTVVRDSLLTLRYVSLNKDYSTATIIYTCIGEDEKKVGDFLNENSTRYRHLLARKLNMKKTPKLVFVHDEKGLAMDRMSKFLDTIE